MVEGMIISAFLSSAFLSSAFTGLSLWFSKREKERAVQAGILVVNGVAYKVERLYPNELPFSFSASLMPEKADVKEHEKTLKSKKHCGGCK